MYRNLPCDHEIVHILIYVIVYDKHDLGYAYVTHDYYLCAPIILHDGYVCGEKRISYERLMRVR